MCKIQSFWMLRNRNLFKRQHALRTGAKSRSSLKNGRTYSKTLRLTKTLKPPNNLCATNARKIKNKRSKSMGWRFSRRITLFPGCSLNLSKSGVSFSFGSKGFKISVGQRGTFLNMGVSGTGLSNRVRLDSSERDNNSRKRGGVWVCASLST